MPLPVVIPAIAALPHYEGISGWSDWVDIREERVLRFVRATGERGWLHTEPDRAARESPWKGLIAPGALLISMVPGLLPQILVLVGWRTAINSGVDTCRYPAPVPVGGRVRMSAALGRGRMLPGGGCRLPIDVVFEQEGAGEPACTATVVYVYLP